MGSQLYAIIDIGSNTIRLVIYRRNRSGKFTEMENVKAVARLRNYLEADNHLNEQGVRILLNTLKSFKEVTDSFELTQLICVATATLRQSANKNEIVNQVKDEIGYNIEVLTEEEEAYYGYLAVVNSTSINEGVTVDIGGGSTEVTYFQNRELIHSHSFPFGALNLKQMFVKGDVPKEAEMEKIRAYLRKQFESLPWLSNKDVPLIGVGGSARNLVQVDQALKSYPLAGLHQYRMNENDIGFIKSYLLTLPFKKLQKVEGLSKDRADIILPAIEVFQSLYEAIDASSFVLSREGLRDGVFYEQLIMDLNMSTYPDVVEESFQELGVDFNIDEKHVNKVSYIAFQLFNSFHHNGIGHIVPTDKTLLRRGAYVFNLGEYIDKESSSEHTFYILANRTIDGLFHKDRLRVALIASYKSKPIFKQFIRPYKQWFAKQELKKLRTLGALTKFAYSFDSTRRSIVQDISVECHKNEIHITAYCNQDWMPEEYQIEKQKKHLEKAIKHTIHVHFQPYNK